MLINNEFDFYRGKGKHFFLNKQNIPGFFFILRLECELCVYRQEGEKPR
jgi:hypothetical protein